MTDTTTPTREDRIRKAVRKMRRALALMQDAQVESTLSLSGAAGLTLSQLESAEALCRMARENVWDALAIAVPHTKRTKAAR
jgi:hypothetical protein